MTELPDNLPWHALNTVHAGMAISAPSARRYPGDVTPYAGTSDNSPESMRQLAGLFAPGETTYLGGEPPARLPEFDYGDPVPCLQMVGPPLARDEEDDPGIVPLTCRQADAMVALTDVAFPGFFRIRTCEMGAYFGIFEVGELVAMGGERLQVPGWKEVSGICTHPQHTGKGLAARVIRQVLRRHARLSVASFLLVTRTNVRAIELYYRLGFTLRQQVILYPITRSGTSGLL